MKKEYKAGGKGQLKRQDDTPSWVGLPEISRSSEYIDFKTKYGWISVSLKYVEEYENRIKANKRNERMRII